VLGLTLHIELFTQEHYRQSIEPDESLSGLYRDVFFYHWREESQHAILDELEWLREDARLDAQARDQGVSDLIALVGAVDGTLQAQAVSEARFFAMYCHRSMSPAEREAVHAQLVKAYRWQYIVSGLKQSRFNTVLATLVTPEQQARIGIALEPIVRAVDAH
jgi:hypothetical protein